MDEILPSPIRARKKIRQTNFMVETIETNKVTSYPLWSPETRKMTVWLASYEDGAFR